MRTAVASTLALAALIAALPASSQDDRFLPGHRVMFDPNVRWNALDLDEMRPRVSEVGRAIERALAARGHGDVRVMMHFLPLLIERPVDPFAGLSPRAMVGARYAIDPAPGETAREGRTLHVVLSAAQMLSDHAYRDAALLPDQGRIGPRCVAAIINDHLSSHRSDPFPYAHEPRPCLDPRLEDQLRRMLSESGARTRGWSYRPSGLWELRYLNECLLPDPEAYAAFLVDAVAGLFDGTRQERPPGRPLAAFAPEIACEEGRDPR